MRDVILLYRWAERAGVNLYERFSSLKGLTRPELRMMVKTISLKAAGEKSAKSSIQRRHQSIRSYLKFLMDCFIDARAGELEVQTHAEKIKEKMCSRLDRLFMASQAGARNAVLSTSLKLDALEVISTAIHPLSEVNPFCSEESKFRNYCLFHVALETWARRGELVLLELSDLQLGPNATITIKEPSRNNSNKRKDGASLKTNERICPISPQLAAVLSYYVHDFRDNFLRAGIPTTSLFVSAKDGRRLSGSAINKIFCDIGSVEQVAMLKMRLHPHGLRASGASAFRRDYIAGSNMEAGASQSMLRDLQDCMTYLGGWSENSEQPRRYAREAISERVAQLIHGRALPNG